MAFSWLIWAGADYWGNNCYPSIPGINRGWCLTWEVWHRAGRKRRIKMRVNKDTGERCKGIEKDVALKVCGKNYARLDMSRCQVVSPQLEVGCLCRVAEVNTHGNCHRGLWLQTLWEWKRRRGEKEEWVTRAQCAGGGGRQQSGTDKHPHHLCFHFTKQGHRVWEIYPSISSPVPLPASEQNNSHRKNITWRTSIFPKQQACQREHRHQERWGEGDRQSRRNESTS